MTILVEREHDQERCEVLFFSPPPPPTPSFKGLAISIASHEIYSVLPHLSSYGGIFSAFFNAPLIGSFYFVDVPGGGCRLLRQLRC